MLLTCGVCVMVPHDDDQVGVAVSKKERPTSSRVQARAEKQHSTSHHRATATTTPILTVLHYLCLSDDL